jgi:hypothetical protein
MDGSASVDTSPQPSQTDEEIMKKLLVMGLLFAGALTHARAQAEEAAKAPTPPAEAEQPNKANQPARPAPAASSPAAAQPATSAPATAPAATSTAAASPASTGTDAQGQETMPRTPAQFATAINEQIAELGHTPHCRPQAGQCHYWYRSAANSEHEIRLWYNAGTRTIYVFVNRFAEASMNSAAAPVLLRHAAAASRVAEIGRFEWDARNGELRLSTVLNVDSNMDRRALRNLLRLVQAAVDQFAPHFAAIAENHETARPLPTPPAAATGSVSDRYGYMNAIQEELDALGLRPQCQTQQGRCTYEIDSTEARTIIPFVVQYDGRANTLLVTTDRYVTAGSDNPRTDRLLQQLMELNWQQLVPMYQWNAADGKVRLAGALNTDSNLDRRAFRSVVQAVNRVAQRNFRELRGILNP